MTGSKTATTQILVVLRNADPTALTALSSLRRYLGFGDRLLDLRRRVLWELSGPREDSRDTILEALRRGGELWNPNKEMALVRAPGGPIADLGTPIPDGGRWESRLAWDPDRDLDRGVRALRPWRSRGWRLRRGTLWSLHWQEEDRDERGRLTERAAVCRGAREGLLVHPHLEDVRRIGSEDTVPWLPEAKEED
jgi:hypothetical protein